MEDNKIYLCMSMEDNDTITYKQLSASASDCELMVGRQGQIVDREIDDDDIMFVCWGTDLESLIQRMKDYKVRLLILEEDHIKIRKQIIQNKEPVFLEN